MLMCTKHFEFSLENTHSRLCKNAVQLHNLFTEFAV